MEFMSVLLSDSSQYIFLSRETCNGDLVYDTVVIDNTNIGALPGIWLFCHFGGKTKDETWVCSQNFVLQRRNSLEPSTPPGAPIPDLESPLVIVSHQVTVRVSPTVA